MKKRSILLLSLMAILLSSCKQDSKDILHLGVMSSMDFVPIILAKEMGYFTKRGVQVEIHKFYSANDRDAALQSGAIDGSVIDYTGAILQKAGGLELQITSACHAPFCIMVSPNSNIFGLSDLRGQKIAVSRNTVIDFCIEKTLERANIDASEVEKQEINKIPIRFEMLMSEQTAATALPDPFITIALSKGARKLVCMDELGYSTTGIVFTAAAISEKETQLKRFYGAYNEAIHFIQNTPPSAFNILLTKELGFPEDIVSEAQLPKYGYAQSPKQSDLEATLDWLRKKGLIQDDFSIDDLVNTRFTKN